MYVLSHTAVQRTSKVPVLGSQPTCAKCLTNKASHMVSNTKLSKTSSLTYTKLLGFEMSALVSLPFFLPPWLRLVVERLPMPANTSAPGWPPLLPPPEEVEEAEGDEGPRLMAGMEEQKISRM